MKNILILFVGILMFSCSDDLENLNQNIKDPAAVSGESLFTGAEKNLVDQIVDLNVNLNNTKLWSQFLQETTYPDESNYDQVTRTIPANHWDVMYKDVLKDLNEASINITATTYLTPAEEAQKPNKLAIIEVLNVYTYSNLVETFDDVPYTEALDINNLSPKYDDGLTIYKDLLARLTTAINTMDSDIGSFSTADRIYGGDVAKWLKFANSLKLRMGILLSDVEPALAQSTVTEAIAGGVIMSREDNASYQYLSADPNTNPVYANLVLSGRNDFVAGATITDIMNSLDDPRLPLYFTALDGEYVGAEIGSASSYSANSHVAAQFQAATAPGIIFDYAEVEFLLAEAAARSFPVTGSAASHYTAGITESITYWGGSTADATAYLAQPEVAYASALATSEATTPWKEVIGTQKWLALYNRGFEAWTSIRLLDYPVMAEPVDAQSGYPNRYTYPIIEQTLNGASYNDAASAIGGDETENRLFWDLQ
ncbi:MAG: SusD/RagB family nutrient-binding outer membrane lipoprotein [Leeuwenhoekiella sp.]